MYHIIFLFYCDFAGTLLTVIVFCRDSYCTFDYDEYEDYCYTLIQAATIYEESGDYESADICKEELINTKEKLNQLNDRLSYLGKLIYDQPKTTLPNDILDYIKTNC